MGFNQRSLPKYIDRLIEYDVFADPVYLATTRLPRRYLVMGIIPAVHSAPALPAPPPSAPQVWIVFYHSSRRVLAVSRSELGCFVQIVVVRAIKGVERVVHRFGLVVWRLPIDGYIKLLLGPFWHIGGIHFIPVDRWRGRVQIWVCPRPSIRISILARLCEPVELLHQLGPVRADL